VEEMNKSGIKISKSTVYNIISFIGYRRNHLSVDLRSPKITHPNHYRIVEKVRKGKFGAKFMVVGAMTGRGDVPLIHVPPNVQINSHRYVDDVLKPLLEVSVPALYPGELHRIFVHHDKASSQTSHDTQRYAKDLKERLGITIIPNAEIPVKSTDASPIEFYGFGYLKQWQHGRKAVTQDGVWKLIRRSGIGLLWEPSKRCTIPGNDDYD
jgi:hypothetical protein